MDVPRNMEEENCQNKVDAILNIYTSKLNIVFIKPNSHLGLSSIFDFGLEFVFKEEEKVIILEDDTIPHSLFFSFCNEKLLQFNDNMSITSVLGTNLRSKMDINGFFKSYFGFPYWGWATWRAKWKLVPKTDDFFVNKISELGSLNQIVNTFVGTKGLNISWDVRWSIFQYLNNYQVVVPTINLVSNSGFSPLASFTKNELSAYKNLPVPSVNEVEWVELDAINSVEFCKEYIGNIYSFLNEYKT